MTSVYSDQGHLPGRRSCTNAVGRAGPGPSNTAAALEPGPSTTSSAGSPSWPVPRPVPKASDGRPPSTSSARGAEKLLPARILTVEVFFCQGYSEPSRFRPGALSRPPSTTVMTWSAPAARSDHPRHDANWMFAWCAPAHLQEAAGHHLRADRHEHPGQREPPAVMTPARRCRAWCSSTRCVCPRPTCGRHRRRLTVAKVPAGVRAWRRRDRPGPAGDGRKHREWPPNSPPNGGQLIDDRRSRQPPMPHPHRGAGDPGVPGALVAGRGGIRRGSSMHKIIPRAQQTQTNCQEAAARADAPTSRTPPSRWRSRLRTAGRTATVRRAWRPSHRALLQRPGRSIYSGSNEIQRNILPKQSCCIWTSNFPMSRTAARRLTKFLSTRYGLESSRHAAARPRLAARDLEVVRRGTRHSGRRAARGGRR
jgi:hypothetical protein